LESRHGTNNNENHYQVVHTSADSSNLTQLHQHLLINVVTHTVSFAKPEPVPLENQDNSPTISSKLQTLSAIPASIAGVTRNVW
jgi:hypothetical protein